ncbi:MAG: AAA domain-containing protein [Pseudonocardiaceae bacterium]
MLRIQAARVEQEAEHRNATLSRTLGDLHPGLLDLLTRTADDPAWGKRDVSAAWAWSKAHQFVQKRRSAEQDRQLTAEFAANEDRLRHVTGRLVANEAIRACVSRMTDVQVMSLKAYRALVSKTGKKSREFRRAARAAMVKAQDAVPAWVVPLPNLLENIAAERDRFDVVIVDEASQVGIEALFLLWMAPRVIIVGDDKQCTPAAGSMGQLDTVFSRNDEHLAEIDEDIRRIFTPKSHLYEVLSVRSGKDAVIRLREHFRCVPEIINWSSSQFYEDGSGGSGLIPLAERKANSLEPLKVTPVVGGFTEGKDIRCWNKIEAESIVDTLIDCLDDPAYDGMTFGIVVLRTAIRHIQRLDSLIFERISSDQCQERNIRVGTAPYFQGDERDVIFLSMVVADRPHKVTAESYRQSFNVAASRAKHQMWLFTSVQLDQLKSDDLRASLLSYMLHPPSVFGRSPALDEVSADESCEPFDSRFEQRVFREIKQRGYHVVPQYPVGSRTLDLVVAGAGGRIAVECDGSYWHAGVGRQANDARRDRELARMGWQTVRVRESEFELDPARALAQVWAALAKRQIEPGQGEHAEGEWRPIALPDIEDEFDEEQP